MRFPRVRITVRRLIGLVAVIALVLFIARELWDGLPPRFVVEGIPARIERLRPGMSWEETRDILGLEVPWYRGGIGAQFHYGGTGGGGAYENYYVRPPRIVVGRASIRGGPPEPVEYWQSKGTLHLRFRTQVGMKWRRDPSTKLEYSSFSSDGRMIAEMTDSR